MKRNLFLLFCLLAWYQFASAQTAPAVDSVTTYADEYATDSNSAEADEEEVVPLSFDAPVPRRISDDSMKALKQDKDFAYMKYIDSVYRNYKEPPQEPEAQEEREESSEPWMIKYPGLRALYWLLAFAAVGFLLWKLFLGKSSVFSRNKKLQAVHEAHEAELAEHLPVDERLDNAIRSGNYRLAIRYLYLQTLEKLGEKGLLNIAPQKTNHQYVNELREAKLKPLFSRLTLQYEYSWYGEFALSQEQFNSVHNSFKNFNESF